MLLNQTWGPLAYLLPLACGEGKCSVYCEAADKESRKLMLKIPLSSLDGFQQRILKTRVRKQCHAAGLCDQFEHSSLIGRRWDNRGVSGHLGAVCSQPSR